jgi:hypothetical protein
MAGRNVYIYDLNFNVEDFVGPNHGLLAVSM